MEFYYRGSVWWADEQAISLLPSESRTVVHQERPFLILSKNEENLKPDQEIFAGCPMSTSEDWVTAYDVEMNDELSRQYGFDKRSWIRIGHIQPIERKFLKRYKGILPEEKQFEVDSKMIDYLALLSSSQLDISEL